MNKSRQFRPVTVGVLMALVWMSGKASAAQCGSTAAGFETWKKQFADEAQARGVSASTVAALMATTYSTATIAADRGQRSFSLSLAKRGGSAIVARGRALKQSNATLFTSIQSGEANFAALEAWNGAPVYQRAIALIGRRID